MPVDAADHLLVAGVRRGDEGAWQELIGRFEGRLLAFVDSRLHDRATAEDVVQETLLGFLTSLPSYDESTPLESFLFAIASHKLIDVLRRRGRRPALPLAMPDSDGCVSEPPGTARVASSIARSHERRSIEEDMLSECLRSLIDGWMTKGEFERLECIELLFVLGWPNKEVAQRLGISEQAVANHKQFAVSKLKEAARQARLRDADLADCGIE